MPNGRVVGTILPQDDPMTRLGLLLRDGLPNEEPMSNSATPVADAMDAMDRENETAEPHACETGKCERVKTEPFKPLYRGVVQFPAPVEWQNEVDFFRSGGPKVDKDYPAYMPRKYELDADLDPIEFLLAYRELIVRRYAPLATMHKHGGKWDETRRSIRGLIKKELRKEYLAKKDKVPGEEALTDIASADPRYVDALKKAQREDTEYELLKDEIEAIDYRIAARSGAQMQYTKSMGL